MSNTETETLERSQQTGFSDSTSSSSAERYRLDEEDERPILLYKYRGGLQTSSQKDLCCWLDKDDKLRVTRKPIPRLTSYINIKRHDLYMPHERERYADFPNYNSDLASVKIPSLAYWSRFLMGSYQDLYIVSPESSPASSQADGDESPRVATWGTDSQEEYEEREARLGAVREREDGEPEERGRT